MESLRKTFFKQNGILAWIVCLGMLMSNMIVQGINCSFGELMSTIINEFDSDLASVSLIPSIHSFAYYLSGYICSILVKWYSFRCLAFFGGLASCIAFVASIFSSNITSLTISYGLFGGMGNGIVYIPGLIACGFYFDDHKRALATSIATSGNGIGIIVIPILMNYINENYGWRDSMLFLSLISPVICLVSLVMLPLSMLSVDTEATLLLQNATTVEDGQNNNNLQITDVKNNHPNQETKSDSIQLQNDSNTSAYFAQTKHFFLDSWNLLKQPKLLMYCISHGLLMVGYFIPIDFLSSMMVEKHGISTELSGYIVPIMGVANFVGNLFTGVFITKFKLSPLSLHTWYNIGCGISCFLFCFCNSYAEFVAIAFMYGMFSGPISMLIMECLAKMFGMDLVKDTIGFIMLVYAMGSVIGAPIGGYIYDIGNDFDGVFCFSAALYLLAAICGGYSFFLNRKYEKITAEYTRI